MRTTLCHHDAPGKCRTRLAALLWLLVGPLAAAPPQRVMSISLCTDQLLLDLLPASRISSVTWLSRRSDESYLSREAWKVGVNYGTGEDVVREHPDLVLAGLYTTPATRELIKAVGIPIMELPPARSFQDIRDQTRQLGHALGVDARAEQLLRQMDVDLATLAQGAPKRRISVVGWRGGGTLVQDDLFNAILTAAGATNLALLPGNRSALFDTERLLVDQPDVLAIGDSTIATPALQNGPLQSPLLQHEFAGREIVYPELLYDCGLPQSVEAVTQMRRTILAALRKGPAA
jgi:iron complex transport system substrate-binding protein